MNIAAKILAVLLPLLVNAPVSFVCFSLMLLAMNGYMSVGWALPVFLVWILFAALKTGVLSVLTTHILIKKKELNAFLAAGISAVIFAVFGSIFSGVGVFIGIFALEIQRRL